MMFDAKKLTDDQIASIQSWAADGDQLADIQKRLEQEYEFKLTYMDTRFLILDLGIELRNLEEEAAADADQEEDPTTPQEGELTEDDLEIMPPPAGGPVRVTVDEIARPGVMVSGRVTFPDGQGGGWYVDEMGRLGIDPDTVGYRPSEADLVTFQRELQSVMERH
ncbi:hypothetical protein HW115_14975 [Verrucomicrobiaceae bacterium N1E253]|uniref:Uncharacterized protein n=2 Tax=Oceaniferula marina TaxID=2748318 RepID=A0A851GP75_9BACT|nr:hypothetical protein [Oceaniferula marina]